MFKKENQIVLYLIGILIMFGVLILLAKNFIPFFLNPNNTGVLDPAKPSNILIESEDYLARIYTNFGVIIIDLYEESAPNNVNNFVYLSELDFYTGTKFHRLFPDLLLHGGDRNTLNDDPLDDGFGKTNYFIDDELNWENIGLNQDEKNLLASEGYVSNPNINAKKLDRFAVAMANQGPNTNSSQFFIVLSDFDDTRVKLMNGKYTVIGGVTEGGDVLKLISEVDVDNSDVQLPKPLQEISIEKVEIFTR